MTPCLDTMKTVKTKWAVFVTLSTDSRGNGRKCSNIYRLQIHKPFSVIWALETLQLA